MNPYTPGRPGPADQDPYARYYGPAPSARTVPQSFRVQEPADTRLDRTDVLRQSESHGPLLSLTEIQEYSPRNHYPTLPVLAWVFAWIALIATAVLVTVADCMGVYLLLLSWLHR